MYWLHNFGQVAWPSCILMDPSEIWQSCGGDDDNDGDGGGDDDGGDDDSDDGGDDDDGKNEVTFD